MQITPILELAPLDDYLVGRNQRAQIFNDYDTDDEWHEYWGPIVTRLKNAHGLYFFYDSMAKPLYVGRAEKQSIWDRANQSFNNPRGENPRDTFRFVHVAHPTNSVKYNPAANRRIQRSAFSLYDVATYFSAYELPDNQIRDLEAFCIRAFAGVILNTRFEGLGTRNLPGFEVD